MEQAPSAEAYHEITRPMHQWEEGVQKAKAVKDATKKVSSKVKADKAEVPIASSEGTDAAKGLKGLAG